MTELVISRDALAVHMSFFETVAELAYLNPSEALGLIQGDFPSDFPYLRSALIQHVCKCYLDKNNPFFEKDIKKIFYSRINMYLPGAYFVKTKVDKKNKPDAFLVYNGKYAVVEIKRRAFTNKGLDQLRRYMNFYKYPLGVAVAKSFDCAVHDDIIYVTVSEQ